MRKTRMMKGATCWLLALALMLAALPAFAAELDIASMSQYGTIRNPNGGTYVNVRSWPSYDSDVVAMLGVGTSVQITGSTGTWYSVWVDGVIGYIHSNFVTFGSGPTYDTNATVRSGPLNVREAPTMRARVITQLPTGSRVYVSSRDGTWSTIELDGRIAYVVTSYLNFDGGVRPTPDPPVNTPNANATIRTSNGGHLNLRSWGSSSAPIIGAYANGSRIRVLSQDSGWYRVQVGNAYGYMSSSYIVMDGGGGGGTTGYSGYVSNAGQGVNLREQPTTTARSLGLYSNGTSLRVLGVGTEWHRVSVNGVTGYMMAKYVQISSGGATPHKTITGGSGGWVNLRSGPGYEYGVLRRVNNGSAATVVIPYPTWSYVLVRQGSGFQNGYILNSFLK